MDPNKSVKVTYREGAFHPDEPCDLPEGFETTITLTTVPPPLTDPEERKKSVPKAARTDEADADNGRPAQARAGRFV